MNIVSRLNACQQQKYPWVEVFLATSIWLYKNASITARAQDTVACLGNSVLDGLRADCRGSVNLVAGDRGDPVGAAAR